VSTALRSEGWSVQPSFVPNGAVTPVTLLIDGEALTQLAGEAAVAWQTPWTELSNVQLVHVARGMALFATVGGVRYCWRHPKRADFDALRAIVIEHGGSVARQRRRAGVYSVAVIVLVAALAGGIGSWLYGHSSGSHEIADVRRANLTLNDLPTGWYSQPSTSALSYLFSAPGKLATPSAQKPKKPSKAFTTIAADFATCLGVTPRRDRVYGAAGQQPDYQVSSKMFGSTSFGGIEVISLSQYYRTATMVRRDTLEMSRRNFGACFVSSSVHIVGAVLGVTMPASDAGANYRPVTFLRGWSRGGEAPLNLPKAPSGPHLVMVEITHGHYELTLGVLVNQWPQSQEFVSSLTSTLLGRIVSPTSKPV
jgi:hypothetical protein